MAIWLFPRGKISIARMCSFDIEENHHYMMCSATSSTEMLRGHAKEYTNSYIYINFKIFTFYLEIY